MRLQVFGRTLSHVLYVWWYVCWRCVSLIAFQSYAVRGGMMYVFIAPHIPLNQSVIHYLVRYCIYITYKLFSINEFDKKFVVCNSCAILVVLEMGRG